MSLTQFAMVEELAFLVKNNLPCKHLVLSMEETLIDFLNDDESSNAALELEPMNPYNRLLLHRLADIFGFSHQSVGEGDERHLVLERCSETSIPPILVSDLLWQYDDEHRSTVASHTVLRVEASQGVNTVKRDPHVTVAEREAAYLAARQRIFAAGEGVADESLKQKPPSNPVVARRMIAHALGKTIKATDEANGSNREYYQRIDDSDIQVRTSRATNSELNIFKDGQTLSSRRYMRGEPEFVEYNGGALSSTSNEVTTKEADKLRSTIDNFGISEVQKANLKKEQTGAAKRMFANALGYHSGRESNFLNGSQRKHNKERPASISK
ncbi:putative R3H domain, SUZ domain-containing protein [Heracleum sosnowskyi]|uniref:R3H domain, SUZ domain-containing protein n=1 Tax=Heracleum sosnowskyi TaxID=360622 RepID=A0AAD8J9Y6_9APIA|nr:putative R3H domain, SUZ domain-containing protein [Heracleum sosnowskyi]